MSTEITPPTELKAKARHLLVSAAQKGYLTSQELQKRLNSLEAAQGFQDIDNLVTDLLSEPSERPQSTGTRSLTPRGVTTLTLLSERRIAGAQLGDQTSSLTVMGSTVLDYSEIHGVQEALLEVLVVMGETTIILPSGTPLEIRAFPIMGSISEGRNLNIVHQGPRLIVQGAVIMGEVKIKYV